MAVIGLLAAAAGQSRAGVVLQYSATIDYRDLTVQDPSYPNYSGGFHVSRSGGGGTSTFSDPYVAATATNSTSSTDSPNGLTFLLSNASSLSAAPGSFASLYSYAISYQNFTVDSTGLYNLAGTLSVASAGTVAVTNGGSNSFSSYSIVYLFDNDARQVVFDYRKTYADGNLSVTGSIPSGITLQAGVSYQLYGYTGTSGIFSRESSDTPGSAEQSADAQFSLTEVSAVPEPSTIISVGMAGLVGLGLVAYRRRKAKVAA